MLTAQLILSPADSINPLTIRKATARQLRLPYSVLGEVRVVKRSVDARQRQIRVWLTVQAFMADEDPTPRYEPPVYHDVSKAEQTVLIVGAGPAGLFAALTLLERGIKPIVIDRGKEVSQRKRDIAFLNRNQGLNTESNYCFGEGGAGTFSDGKLFSRSKKRGDMQRVMELFHFFGADEKILYETHAHIGSDRLPAIIRRIRETIIEYGGEVHFEEQLMSLDLKQDVVSPQQQITNNQQQIKKTIVAAHTNKAIYRPDAIVLAIGHSAHDTYRMLINNGVTLEAKGFAMGVRAEHPQALINSLMYHTNDYTKELGNAAYSLVTQVDGRGVYSFCMCPGGHIVPAGTDTESCVVNGMSASHRNSPYANSGIVVELRAEDFHNDPLEALLFQEQLEHLAFQHGDRESIAPAQRLEDFVFGRETKTLPPSSYLPGLRPSRLDMWLPPMIGKRLQQGFRDFNRKYPGFLINDAIIVGVESRTSSPVRIPRDHDTMQHIDISNLYPVGEGAGYAGGITSSALDGIRATNVLLPPPSC